MIGNRYLRDLILNNDNLMQDIECLQNPDTPNSDWFPSMQKMYNIRVQSILNFVKKSISSLECLSGEDAVSLMQECVYMIYTLKKRKKYYFQNMEHIRPFKSFCESMWVEEYAPEMHFGLIEGYMNEPMI